MNRTLYAALDDLSMAHTGAARMDDWVNSGKVTAWMFDGATEEEFARLAAARSAAARLAAELSALRAAICERLMREADAADRR